MVIRPFHLALTVVLLAPCGCDAHHDRKPVTNSQSSHQTVMTAQPDPPVRQPAGPVEGRFHYHFEETTGDNQYAQIEGVDLPIHFDTVKSDSKALLTLTGLSWPILYCEENHRNIFIVGRYEPSSQKFILRKWSINPPFYRLWREFPNDALPGKSKVNIATHLVRSDFQPFWAFDPKDPKFHPDDYVIKQFP